MKHALALVAIVVSGAIAQAGPEMISSKEAKETVMEAGCPIDWNGFYVGIHAGYGFGNCDTDQSTTSSSTDPTIVNVLPTAIGLNPSGVLGGAQLGYNWQFHKFVLGFEADINGGDIDDSGNADALLGNRLYRNAVKVNEHIDWFGSFRLKMGYTPTCQLLLYATGGIAYGHIDYSSDIDFRSVPIIVPPGSTSALNDPSLASGQTAGGSSAVVGFAHYPASLNEVPTGFAMGAGGQYALNRRWSIKLEYLFYGFGDAHASAKVAAPLVNSFTAHYNWVDTQLHTVNVGLNYQL